MTDFWKTKSLEEMTTKEWESICDGCAMCCLHRIEDEDTGKIYPTWVSCQYLNMSNCQCTRYQTRSDLVKTCVTLNPKITRKLYWMPVSCSYRLLAEGKDLPPWHPLVSGNSESVHESGVSVRNKTISETEIDMDFLEDYVIDDEE
jgi:uncharacterized cysteine cluster protein YcgN (CxxCxxCC family)